VTRLSRLPQASLVAATFRSWPGLGVKTAKGRVFDILAILD